MLSCLLVTPVVPSNHLKGNQQNFKLQEIKCKKKNSTNVSNPICGSKVKINTSNVFQLLIIQRPGLTHPFPQLSLLCITRMYNLKLSGERNTRKLLCWRKYSSGPWNRDSASKAQDRHVLHPRRVQTVILWLYADFLTHASGFSVGLSVTPGHNTRWWILTSTTTTTKRERKREREEKTAGALLSVH